MRVLQILTGKLSYDGISTVALNILRHMPKEEIQVDLVAQWGSDPKLVQEVRNSGAQITIMEGRLRKPLQYVRKLREVLKNTQYDIIHIHGNSATVSLELAAASQSSSIVKIVHSHNTTCKYKLLHQLLQPYMYRHTDCFLACGTEAGKWLCKEKSFQVINNGIDVKKYTYSPNNRIQVRTQLGYSEDCIVLGHVGVFNQQKNQLFLLSIFSQLLKQSQKEYRLLLIGTGELLEQAKSKAKELQIEDKVSFYGTTDKIHEILSAMDIFVMPSLYEGLPLSLIEAQASGLPVLASDAITKEVNLTGNIQFCKLESGAAAWAEQIEHISVENRNISKQEIVKNIAAAGYDIESEMHKLENIYRKLLK